MNEQTTEKCKKETNKNKCMQQKMNKQTNAYIYNKQTK